MNTKHNLQISNASHFFHPFLVKLTHSSGQIHMTIMCIFAVLTKQSGSALQEDPVYVYRDRTVILVWLPQMPAQLELVQNPSQPLLILFHSVQCMKTSELYHLIRNTDDMRIWTNLLKEPSPSSLITCFMYRSTRTSNISHKRTEEHREVKQELREEEQIRIFTNQILQTA